MSTQAILNPANILTTPAQGRGSSQAPSSSPEVPFNQVLQREMNGHREDQPVKSSTKDKETQASPAQAPSGQTPAQKTKSADAADKKASDATDDTGEELENAAAASAELLALVTNMAQIANPQTAASETATAADTSAASNPVLATGTAEGITDKLMADPLAGKGGLDTSAGQEPHAGNARSFADIARNIGQNHAAADKQAANPLAASAESGTSLQTNALAPSQEFVLPESVQAATVATSPMTVAQQALNKVQSTFAADKLTPPVGTPAWDQAVGQKVVWMVAGGQQSASLTLNPPDLGPLQVVLNVNNAQANATFVAAQPEVRQALEAALPKLREMLGEAGIQLGQASVNAGHSQQGNSFTDQHSNRQSSGNAGQDDKQDAHPAQGVRRQIIKSGNGMVDTFA